MNIGAFSGIAGSIAGGTASQIKGTEADRTARETADRAREVDAVQRSEAAADVGEDSDDVMTGERDADGRELWERRTRDNAAAEATDETPADAVVEPELHQSKDPTGASGGRLDITG